MCEGKAQTQNTKYKTLSFIIFVFHQAINDLLDGLIGVADREARRACPPVTAAVILGEHQTDIYVAPGIKNTVPHIHGHQILTGVLVANPHIDSRFGKQ